MLDKLDFSAEKYSKLNIKICDPKVIRISGRNS